jgi:CheY-like chemotaxis protein
MPAERVRGPARTVLLVEDNPSNIKLVETILGDRPEVTLIVATRGELAVELAVEHRPALVLLDLNLPDVSGEVVLRRLRSDERTAETPIVVVSADATPRQVLRIRRAGADDYLTKPFGLERFLAVIDGSGLADGAAPTAASRAAEAPGVLDAATIRTLHALASRPTVGPSAVRELLEVFLVDSRERLAALEVAARADDLAGVERQAHALAGASGGVGSAEFTTLCRRVEAAAKAGDAQSVRSTVSELGPALDAACAVLAAEFGLP